MTTTTEAQQRIQHLEDELEKLSGDGDDQQLEREAAEERRRLAETTGSTGIKILADYATISFGPEGDAQLVRSGEKQLSILGHLNVSETVRTSMHAVARFCWSLLKKLISRLSATICRTSSLFLDVSDCMRQCTEKYNLTLLLVKELFPSTSMISALSRQLAVVDVCAAFSPSPNSLSVFLCVL